MLININGKIFIRKEMFFSFESRETVMSTREKFINYNNEYINKYTDNSDQTLKFYKEVIDKYKIKMGGIGIEPMTFTV